MFAIQAFSTAAESGLLPKTFATLSSGFTRGDSFGSAGLSKRASASCGAPAVSMNERSMSTIVFPRHFITMRFVSVTVATTTALRFSAFAASMNFCTFSLRTTTAMRSWLSLIASSVPSRPSYFLGTASKLMSRPGASSPTATLTPPAPKSLQRRIIRHASLLRKRR